MTWQDALPLLLFLLLLLLGLFHNLPPIVPHISHQQHHHHRCPKAHSSCSVLLSFLPLARFVPPSVHAVRFLVMDSKPPSVLKASLPPPLEFQPQVKRVRTEASEVCSSMGSPLLLQGHIHECGSVSARWQCERDPCTSLAQEEKVLCTSGEKANKELDDCNSTCESFKHLFTQESVTNDRPAYTGEEREVFSTNTSENTSTNTQDVKSPWNRSNDKVASLVKPQGQPYDMHAGDCCQESGNAELSTSENHQFRGAMLDVTSKASTVFVWDLDETLIIFQTLSNGRYAEQFKGLKDSRQGVKLGRRWEKLIIQVCDDFFFYEQVEDYNEPNLESWRKYDDGADLLNYDFRNDGLSANRDDLNNRKLAYRHRQISHLYTQGLETLLREEQLQEWRELYEVTDAYTDGWLTAGRTILECCLKSHQSAVLEHEEKDLLRGMQRGENLLPGFGFSDRVNVLVTSGSLVPSLAKCLLFKLDKFISHKNVYSSREVGKPQCFEWIRQRFNNPGVKFCAIGDGLDECEAAQALRWPFVKVEMKPDGYNRLPTLSLPTIESYIRVIYEDDNNDLYNAKN